MDFKPESKSMRIIQMNPGYLTMNIQDNCGFELLQATKITDTEPPTDAELKILREEVDPYRYVIGR